MVSVLRPGNSVYCVKPVALRAAAARFLEGFPGRTLYAVKCNPHPFVLQTLHEAGIVHFDGASIPEIAAVRGLGSDTSVYYMHPVKTRDAILTAYTVYGVRHFVVDHPDELDKVFYETNQAKDLVILVRFATPGGVARYELSQKFGALPANAADLLKQVTAAGCRAGLAFHVGSQCLSPDAYRQGIGLAADIAARAGVAIDYLDVGGGFPATYVNDVPPPLDDFFAAIRRGIDEAGFAKELIVMCEPGRALVASGLSLVVQVQLRKEFLHLHQRWHLPQPVRDGDRRPVASGADDPGRPSARRRQAELPGIRADLRLARRAAAALFPARGHPRRGLDRDRPARRLFQCAGDEIQRLFARHLRHRGVAGAWA